MRRFFNKLSIKRKIASIIVLTTTTILLLASLIFAIHSFSYFKTSLTDELSILASTICSNTTAAISFNDVQAAEKNLRVLEVDKKILQANICLPDGKVFATYNSSAAEALLLASDRAHYIHHPLQLTPFDSGMGLVQHKFHTNHLDTFMPIQLDGETIGYVGIRAGLKNMKERLVWSILFFIVLMGAITLTAYFISVRMSQKISDPIIQLVETMQEVSTNKNYAVRAVKQNEDETGILIDGFNEMLAKIEKRDEALYFTQFSVDHAGVAVLWIDSGGRLIYANEAAVARLGYSREELLSMSVADFYVGISKAIWQEHWQELKERKTVTLESEYRRKDGTIFPVEISANHVYFQGKEYNFSFAIEVTEKKRMEQELQVAEKMKTIGNLTAGVAHDLNNILCSLVGFPEILLMELPPDDPKREILNIIKDSGHKAAAIVQDLLTLARKGVAPSIVFNLNSCLQEYLSSNVHRNLLENLHPDIEITTTIKPNLPNIKGVAIHLSKAIMNLTFNAVEAMPSGGKLKYATETRKVEKGFVGRENIPEGEYVVLSIEDTGSGIAPEDIHRIFEPFYSKKKLGTSGTGLGMTVVWSTVKDCHGYIDLQSTEGEGSRFQLYFPVCHEDVEHKELPVNINEYKGNERIVVVDDISDQRELARSILSKLGYNVVTVESGEKAVEYMKKNQADLLILDMIMDPGMDGLDTYTKIRESHPNQKAIIISGYADSSRVQEALEKGAGAYVRKPYTIEAIGKAVRTELDRKG